MMSGLAACVHSLNVLCSHLHKHIPASYLNKDEHGGRGRQTKIKNQEDICKEKVK